MQYLTHWPDKSKLALPDNVANSLYSQLLEPFDSESSAKALWEEVPSTIIVLNSLDSIEQLENSDIWEEIVFVLTYTEYTVPLVTDYQLMVAIVNDSGSCIFLVIPPDLLPALTDKQTALNNSD